MTERNDPCPCGSGLKYKKCHGKSATKGGKFAAKPSMDKLMGSPPKPEEMMFAISREIYRGLHVLDAEELARREAIRKQQFR